MKKPMMRAAAVVVACSLVASCAREILVQQVNRAQAEARTATMKCPPIEAVVERGLCMNAMLRQFTASIWPSGVPADVVEGLDAHAEVFAAHAAGGVSAEETWRRHGEWDRYVVDLVKYEIAIREAKAVQTDRVMATAALVGLAAAQGARAAAAPARGHNAASKPVKPSKVQPANATPPAKPKTVEPKPPGGE